MRKIDKKMLGVVVSFVTILALFSIFKGSIPIKQMFAEEPKVAAAAQGRPESLRVVNKNILKNVDIYSLYNKSNEVKLDQKFSMVPNRSSVRTEWNFELEQMSESYKKGDTFEFPFPNDFEIEASGEGPIKDESKEETAYYIVDKDQQKIKIILMKDLVQAKYKVTSRAFIDYKNMSEAMVKDVTFKTNKGDQTYKISVPENLKIKIPT